MLDGGYQNHRPHGQNPRVIPSDKNGTFNTAILTLLGNLNHSSYVVGRVKAKVCTWKSGIVVLPIRGQARGSIPL